MDGWRSERRRWACTTKGGGAGLETWTTAERSSPARVELGWALWRVTVTEEDLMVAVYESDFLFFLYFIIIYKIIKNKARGFWFVLSPNEIQVAWVGVKLIFNSRTPLV